MLSILQNAAWKCHLLSDLYRNLIKNDLCQRLTESKIWWKSLHLFFRQSYCKNSEKYSMAMSHIGRLTQEHMNHMNNILCQHLTEKKIDENWFLRCGYCGNRKKCCMAGQSLRRFTSKSNQHNFFYQGLNKWKFLLN